MTPRVWPPVPLVGTPNLCDLPEGRVLTRIHSAHRQACGFNATQRTGVNGGRFDASDNCDFAYLYVAADASTAISEKLLRDRPAELANYRVLPESTVTNQVISWMTTTSEMVLIDLRSDSDLAAIGQDDWLTSCDAIDYPITRLWCAALRDCEPDAQGFVWQSRFEPAGESYVFFKDRCTDRPFEMADSDTPLPVGQRDLWHSAGREYLTQQLDQYDVAVSWSEP